GARLFVAGGEQRDVLVADLRGGGGGDRGQAAAELVLERAPRDVVRDHAEADERRHRRHEIGAEQPGEDRDATRHVASLHDDVIAQGKMPAPSRPADSSQPRMTLTHCTAWPAAPLTRLSMA